MATADTVTAAWPAPPAYYRGGPREAPAPVKGEFSMFGVTRNSEPQPPPAPEHQMYDTNCNPYSELRRLNNLLLSTFVSLVDVMAENPSHADVKVGELRQLLLNFQHLLNSLRPAQANLSHRLSTRFPAHPRGIHPATHEHTYAHDPLPSPTTSTHTTCVLPAGAC